MEIIQSTGWVTMGWGRPVIADIHAQDVAAMGSVKGNIDCGHLLDIQAGSRIRSRRSLPGAYPSTW